MNPTSLRNFVKRHGTIGLLLVGAYLAARHVWYKRRAGLAMCIAALLASSYAVNFTYHPFAESASRGSHRLYLGRISAEAQITPKPIEQQLLRYWAEGSTTDEVRAHAHEFALAVERKDPVLTRSVAARLYHEFVPDSYLKTDSVWLLHAGVGEIYLEQGWLSEADREFSSVMAAVPPGEPQWGRSIARQISAYGLARECSLQGSYFRALKWLQQAPGEYNNGCGNHNEGVADDDYPMEAVWTTACKPYPVAINELEAIMRGRFKARSSWLNGDTSEEQRQHAALEAGLTLGCIYYDVGRRGDARACWRLVASCANSKYDAVGLAEVMLDLK